MSWKKEYKANSYFIRKFICPDSQSAYSCSTPRHFHLF